MKKNLQLISFLLILMVNGNQLFSQEFRFKSFSAERGLSNKYINNIIQGSNGYLWLGSGEGVFRFDGFQFIHEFPGDTLPARIVISSFRDSKDRLWFGYRDGSIAVLEGVKFRLIKPDENHNNSINSFTETGSGHIVAATQDKGFILISAGYDISYISQGLEGLLISSLCITSEGHILTGTFDGMFLCSLDVSSAKASVIGRVEGIPFTKVQTISSSPDKKVYWAGTETDGLFMILPGAAGNSLEVKPVGADLGLQYANVLDIYEDKERNIWVGTNGEGVFRILPGNNDKLFSGVQHFNANNGLPSNYVSDIFEDSEGNLWFATIGEAITVLKDQSFTFYSFETEQFNNNILSLENVNGKYYLGGEAGILVTDKSGIRPEFFLDRRNGLPTDKITALFSDKEGDLWVGTSRSGVYLIKQGSRSAIQIHFSQNSLENIINAINSDGQNIWIGTNGGALSYNIAGRKWSHFTTTERLPHNKINDLFPDSKGNVWIATRTNGLYSITTRKEYRIEANTELEFVSVAQDKDGMLWGATNGDGVFHFTEDSLFYYSTANGLLSNYCYSIAADREGNIWVGHSSGLSRIEPGTGQIRKFSIDQGISANCNYNARLINSRQNLVIGTSGGMIEFDPAKERKSLSPPKLNISALKINDLDYDFSRDIRLPYGKYKIRIDFIGINHKNPEGVVYQYKLDGYDDWSEPSGIPYVIYSRIEDGNYTFKFKACSDSNICNDAPLELKISVKIPVWKTWWFILLVAFSLVGSVFAIIKYREKKQKEIQEYLEKELDLRTKEVIQQAEVIENKNRDITDSINYAQRIQASILPPIKRLQDTFSSSFVFYQPRDIVSGDFYWYDKVWDNKFVIVCADSTGHGVPGAFMSMIGTTLIKDICNRPGVRSPSRILSTLDAEIMSALNQNLEAEKSNDGMDIVVAEIDIKTKHLRIASAMRPMILYINGKQIYVKGSRYAVGGHHDQDSEPKVFHDEEFQLAPGDILYMFSDGYPDQFGGPLGKKFKMVRLKNLLNDIFEKPMEEQYSYVKSNFNLWKEELEQVDDVLFMGLKI